MKKIYFILLLFGISGLTKTIGQKSVHIYSGLNASYCTLNTYSGGVFNDTLSRTLGIYYGFNGGFDIDFYLGPKWDLSLGLGINVVGGSDFYQEIEGDIFEDNLQLKLNNMSLPIKVKYKIAKKWWLTGGYALQYNVRKNQNLLAFDPLEPIPNPLFQRYQHIASIGAELEWKSLRFSANYLLWLQKILDTGSVDPSFRYSLSLSGFQVCVGYVFRDE